MSWSNFILLLLLGLAVAAATFVTFRPVLDADFVRWDDDKNILQNPYFRGLGGEQIGWMFTTFKMGHYQPLSWLTLAIDYLIGGLEPRRYHQTNLVLHCATALAIVFLCFQLFRIAVPATVSRAPRTAAVFSSLAALLYAVHPLRVESVAWVTERRDVLSGLFFVLTLIAYLRACTARADGRLHVGWYLLAVFWLLCCLLSKAWGMTMPAVLIILDVYPLRRLGRPAGGWFSRAAIAVWLQKIPFVALAGFSAVQAARAQAAGYGTMKTLAEHGVVARLGQAFYGLGFYLYKTLVPTNLHPIYEIPPEFTGLEWINWVSAGGVIGITVALVMLRRRWPAGLAVWAYYVVVVSPVLGLLQSGPQLVKDSYTYLCCIGWGMLIGGVLLHVASRETGPVVSASPDHRPAAEAPRFKPAGVAGTCALLVVVVLLAMGATRQAGYWRVSETLFTRVLSIDPNNYNANNNMGTLRREQKRYDEAVAHYRRAIARRPDDANPYYNLGNSLKALRKYDEAVEAFKRAIELEPLLGAAHFNLANTYTNQFGEHEKALYHFREALRIRLDPRAPASSQKVSDLHYCIAFELKALGRIAEAQEHLTRCLQLEPDHTLANKLKIDMVS